MAYTLTQLIQLTRQRADMENSTFVSDTEVTNYINSSYAELYDILVSRFEDYYSSTTTFSLTGSTNTQALPATYYKARGLDYSINGNVDYQTVRKWNFEERNKLGNTSWTSIGGIADRQYRIMGGNIVILPSDKAAGSYRFWYIPRFTPLSGGSTTLGDVLDFEEYIIIDAAIKCLQKEESDVQVLLVLKKQIKERIEAMASNRDVQPDRIADVTSSGGDDFYIGRY